MTAMQTPKQEAAFVALAELYYDPTRPRQFSYVSIGDQVRQGPLVDAWRRVDGTLPPSYTINNGAVRCMTALEQQGLVRANGPMRHTHTYGDTTIVTGWTLTQAGHDLAAEMMLDGAPQPACAPTSAVLHSVA
jgi:hypothetical protein